ncbi:MAG TPA: hypothetical protein EYG33_06125, partial [Candidatus Poseidoniales archaeon]|nr:hypothetical protein [Candidatus Poseidoniales archaeon]
MLLSTALPFADFSIYNPPESLDEQLPSSKVVSGTSEIGDWISAMKIGSSGFDDVREIVSDSQGNVYLHGTFSNTISIGSTNLTSAGNRDMFVAKFSSDGTLIWALRGGGNGSDQGYGGLVLDSNGSVIVTGIFSASGASFGTTSLSAAGSASENLYVAKISSGGSWIWAVTASGNVEGNQVSVTNSDDIIVSGMIQGSAGTFGSYTAGGNGSWDGFVAKLSQSGTWLWANGIGGSGYDGCSIGSVTPDGDILVAGKFSGTIQLGGTQLTSNGGADIYIGRMFTSNGTWKSITSVGGTGNDLLAGRNPVVHDKNGNSYFGGYFENTVSFGNHSITSAGSEDIFVARYNSNDTWGWAKRAGSSGSSDWLYGIQLENEVLTVTGHFSGTADFGSVNLSSSSGYDVFVAGLTSAGEWTWAVSASGSGDDVGRSMAPIGNGISAVTGAFESSLTFGNTSLTSSGNSDVFLAWIKTADTFHISSISPENGTTSGGTNVTLTGGGYDTLPQYRREITVANPYSEAVENLTFDVVDP